MKKIFISYSHKDEAAKDRLLVHLKLLTRQKLIEPWDDRLIRPGEEWDDEIKQALHDADIIFFIMSPDAIASDYIWDVEVKTAMERHSKKEVRVLPLILNHCEWKDTPLANLQGLPRDGKPIATFANQDEAWAKIAAEVRALINLG